MQKENNSDIRRKLLKTTVFGSIAGTLTAVNPLKLFAFQANKNTNAKKMVSIHPKAVKRNKK